MAARSTNAQRGSTVGQTHPGRVLELAGVNSCGCGTFGPTNPDLASSWLVRLAVFFTYTPVLIFAIMGAWRTVGWGWPYILCCLPGGLPDVASRSVRQLAPLS